MFIEVEKDKADARSWATEPWPIGDSSEFYEYNTEVLEATKDECSDKLGRGLKSAYEHRRKVWACHVCGKIVSKRGVGQDGKEKDEKETNQQDGQSLCNGLTPCELCGSAWYCSEKCRRKDWLLHSLLCTQYRLFRQYKPPSDSFSCIGIELPVENKTPRLVWVRYGKAFSSRPQQRRAGIVRTAIAYRHDPFYYIGNMMGGMVQVIKQPGPFWCTRLYVARRQTSLLHPVNECVRTLLRQLGPRAFDSMKGFFDPNKHLQDDKLIWRGPIVLFRRSEMFFTMKAADLEGPLGGRELRSLEVQMMEDMTLADLSWAIEYLAWRQMEVVEHPETANLVPEDWSRWIRSMPDEEEVEEIDE
ncbi:hypothetical protein MCOR27_003564 [Pyricularia oryzae]|uniref:MYND-type domain-containing protein n=1 Tax=Pyricularia grisea TaxID=148305 RepID=A0ABQ8NE86_PYRGI|nr:hypothetical protein MCOR01_007437 [Pyricularia oryzae]KAI6295131.1 hypothetical protein MCOR33_007906 [Pyricularia grisea]KAI6260242.1 hypothetical protein MCOR19_003473 [Pyricularia oryzae]KAI6279517.1 hypothetical protein MCOR26_004146 [Pyricularia oryzae]KAI6282800.1 hypothetical protein MCOR27_003564 [Pyricularia oryzae]